MFSIRTFLKKEPPAKLNELTFASFLFNVLFRTLTLAMYLIIINKKIIMITRNAVQAAKIREEWS